MPRFIPIDKMNKLREASKSGDERAKQLLSMYLKGGHDNFDNDLDDYFKPQPEQTTPGVEETTATDQPQMQSKMSLQQLAQEGNEVAKNVLDVLANAGEEKTNEFLSRIAVADKNKENKMENCSTFVEFVKALILDENEAIQGYDKAILFTVNSENDRNIVAVLNEIKSDEIRHIKMLKELVEC
jgi:hypothetical protein